MAANNNMLTSDDVCTILKAVQSVSSPESLTWELSEASVCTVLPQVRLRLYRRAGSPDVSRVEVQTRSGGLLARVEPVEGDALLALCNDVYEKGRLAGAAALVRHSVHEITTADHVKSEKSVAAPLSPPALPPGPTEEDERVVFDRMKGQWTLDFERGTEEAKIDDRGGYYVRRTLGRAIIQAKFPEQPRFTLKLLSVSNDRTRVEIAKTQEGGRIRQIEVLEISDNEMTGYAKHDRHRLKYIRV